MIRSGLINYFINLKHFFTPIGTLASGVFLGLSIFIPGGLAILSALIEKITEIVQDASIDFTPVKDSVVNAVKALDWNDPIASLQIMFSCDWLSGVLNASLNAVSSGLQPYADAISETVDSAVTGVKLLFALFVFFCILGIILGYFLTRFLVRRNMAKRTLKKFIFASFVDSFITATLVAVCFWLLTLWAPSIFITSLTSLVIFACTALVSAYLVHGKNEIDFKSVINFKNVFKLLLVNALIFLISFAFLFVTLVITNLIAGILIGFAFIEIALIVMSLNAENYVINFPRKVEDIAENIQEDISEEIDLTA